MRDRGVAWSILPAWGAGDPDSNSGGPTHQKILIIEYND